jgi:tripartite-type tricarboxylate transporter receptor subunit TctC
MLMFSPPATFGQVCPAKPIRIVASEPGGGGDFVARQVAPGLALALGQSIVIDNRSTGVIQGEIVSRAAPDGYIVADQQREHVDRTVAE